MSFSKTLNSKWSNSDFFAELVPFLRNNFWVGGTTIFKALAQLVVIKMVTMYFGSEGLGLMGQAASCVVALNSLLSGGLLNFAVTEFSKSSGNTAARAYVFGALGFWLFVVNTIGILIVLFFADYLSDQIFHDPSRVWFFYSLALFMLFFNAHSICTGLLSAEGDVQSIFKSHALALIATVLALFAIIKQASGSAPLIAAYVLLILQAVWLLFFSIRTGRLKFEFFKPVFDRTLTLKILKFTIIMICTGLVTMLFQIAMRNEIVHGSLSDWADVGRWQAIIKVSEITMSFLGLSILTSYLPQVSKISSFEALRNYIFRFGIKYTALAFLVLLSLILLAPIVLRILFDASFVELQSLLRFQLAGDFFKLVGWLCSYFLLAKFPLIVFLLFELSYIGSLYLVSKAAFHTYGISGIIYANVICNLLFFLVGALIMWLVFKKMKWNRFINPYQGL